MIARALKSLGLMRVSEHERVVQFYVGQARNLAAETAEYSAKFKRAATELAELDVAPWKHSCGEPPDYESPLGCVYDSGIGYAYDRLAEWLGVTDYEAGDGSEDYATDVGRTGANVLVAAGFTNDDGDLLTSTDMAALKADAQKWRIARQKRVDAKGGRV